MKVVCPHCAKEFELKSSHKQHQPGERDPFKKMFKILSYLKTQEAWVWIRKIAKNTSLKPYAVSYLIDKYLQNFVEILEPEAVYESTGIRMRMFKLKNKDIDPKIIVEDLIKRNNS
jgi:predicted amidophosphoribosyltransferase